MYTAMPDDGNGLDMYALQRELDKCKTSVFLGKNSAFLGSIMCSLQFIWAEDIATAATDGSTFWWNPHHFLQLPVDTRKTVLAHELWHVARLHSVRCGSRDHRIFNYACDIAINNALQNEGYSFEGTHPWLDQTFGNQVEEDIYDALMANAIKPPPNPWNGYGGPAQPDMVPITKKQHQAAINTVVKAIAQAQASGQAGNLPGNIEKIIKTFLQPVIQWEVVLQQFFSDLANEDYSWARPNRRYSDMYLPARYMDEGRLAKLNYYMDVSGSVSDSDVTRFNSEVKHVKDVYNPQEMNLIQFDTKIQQERKILDHQQFDEIKIVGRGGTSLVPVRQHIEDTKPTAAIIFSDLFCSPMAKLSVDIPVIWVAVGNRSAQVPFGKLIHIRG